MAPRLLTAEGAAEYLSLPLAAVRKLTVGRVEVVGRIRFDRDALDRWLDGGDAPAKVAASNENASAADAALADFLASHPHVARRRP